MLSNGSGYQGVPEMNEHTFKWMLKSVLRRQRWDKMRVFMHRIQKRSTMQMSRQFYCIAGCLGETGWVWLSQSERWDCCLFFMPELWLLIVCTERLQQDYLPPTTDCVMAGHQNDKHHAGHVKNKSTDPHLASSSIIIRSLWVHSFKKRVKTAFKKGMKRRNNQFWWQ